MCRDFSLRSEVRKRPGELGAIEMPMRVMLNCGMRSVRDRRVAPDRLKAGHAPDFIPLA